MISVAHRFHGHASLGQVYKRGQVVRGPQLALKYALNQRRRTYRAAVVVSKKVDKSAVVRNRIRRRIYEIVRLESAGITQPYDMVFTVFGAQLAEVDAKELQRVVRGLLRKAGVITSVSGPARAIVEPMNSGKETE